MRYLAVALAVLSSACCWRCPKPPVVPPAPPKREACLEKAPPELLAWQAVGREGGCPEPYTSCLTAEAAGAMASNYEVLIRYARNAWTLCASKTPDSQPAQPPASQPTGGQ